MRLLRKEHHLALAFDVHVEENIRRYEVEWSADGAAFEKIGQVAPRNNGGGTATYTYQDHRSVAGLQFFRIKAVEEGGAVFYSPVALWSGSAGAQGLIVYAAPAGGGAVQYTAGSLAPGAYQLQVYDAGGRLVWAQNLQHNGGRAAGVIQLPAMQKGLHVLVLNGPQRMRKVFIIR